MVAHEKTKKHQQKVRAAASTLLLPVVRTQRVAENVRHAELQPAIFTACYMSFQVVDHLGEAIAHNGEGSPLGRIKIHCTKCSKLVTEVVATALKEELREDIKGKKFAVLIDESTDVASHKLLCVVLCYFSEREGQILTGFLGLLQVVEATGEVLFNALKESLTDIGLSVVDCIGFGCDWASSMVGKHNSVWSRIKQESPNCLLVPCICHSLALSIAHAFDKLPSHLGHLLSEIPRWFSNSTLRQNTFKTLFDIMDPGRGLGHLHSFRSCRLQGGS